MDKLNKLSGRSDNFQASQAILEKRVAIARSGVYVYGRSELSSLNPGPMPEKYQSKSTFNVYRPAVVLQEATQKFINLPVVMTHDAGWIGPENFKDNVLGWTGDSAEIALDEATGEVTVNSVIRLFDQDAIDFYRDGKREVSPAYKAHFIWSEGVAPDGTPYEIIMDAVEEGNALALVDRGRGGQSAKILDGPKSGIVHFIMDHDLGAVRNILEELAIDRQSLSSEEIAAAIDKVWKIAESLPDTEEKEVLHRYLLDFPHIKDLDDEKAEKFTNLIADLYESLDTDAMEDSMFGRKKKGAQDEAPVKEEQQETVGEEVKAKDDDENISAEQPPITIDDIPQSPEEATPEHHQYMWNELKELIRSKADAAGNPGGAEEPIAEDEAGTEEESEETPAPVGDSRTVFSSSPTTQSRASALGEFVNSIYTKKGKK